MNFKYLFGTLFSIPLLPIMYFQGKRIKARIPKLPEAQGVEGVVLKNTQESLQLLTIGESTIAGVGVKTHDEGFTGTLAKVLSEKLATTVKWKVYARSGHNTKKVTETIIPQIKEKRVDLIVIGLGGNDAFELNTPMRWKRHIGELIAAIKVKFTDTPIFFTNMPPIKAFPAFTPIIKFTLGNLVEILGKELAELVSDYDGVFYYTNKITLEDWIDRLDIKAEPAAFFSDGVHPSKLTYQTWGGDMANFILANKESMTRSEKDLIQELHETNN
ncbi:SGNH/GDSL hydrolase family protein [Sungkyunkwania multivorans]|uniref:SGNH/GDSL hydrolase family protein n=1 Tax=Sungkyunkwania multivorans TaxID=1173618 RepID=A0ABW3CX57_9FLAO